MGNAEAKEIRTALQKKAIEGITQDLRDCQTGIIDEETALRSIQRELMAYDRAQLAAGLSI